jgi:hypothetical protein
MSPTFASLGRSLKRPVRTFLAVVIFATLSTLPHMDPELSRIKRMLEEAKQA